MKQWRLLLQVLFVLVALLITSAGSAGSDGQETPEGVRVELDSHNSVRWQRMPDEVARLHLVRNGKKQQVDMQLGYKGDVQSLAYKDESIITARVNAYRSGPKTILLNLDLLTATHQDGPTATKLLPVNPEKPKDLSINIGPFTTASLHSGSPNVRLVDFIGGDMGGVAVDEKYMLLGTGLRLSVYNISDPTTPVEIDKFLFNELVTKPVISGSLVAALVGDTQLAVLQIIDDRLVLAGIMELPGKAHDLAASEGRFYAGGDFGVVMADFRQPNVPVAYNAGLEPGIVKDLVCSGSLVCASDSFFGLRMVEFANPQNPKLVQNFSAADKILSPPMFVGNSLVFLTAAGETAVSLTGDGETRVRSAEWPNQGLLYVRDGGNGKLYEHWGDNVISIKPEENSRWTTATVARAGQRPSYIKTAVAGTDDLLIAATSAECRILATDSAGSATKELAVIPLLGHANAVTAEGGHAVIAGQTSVRVISLKDDDARLRGQCRTGSVTEMITSGSEVIMATYSNGLQSLDVSSLDSPKLSCKGESDSTRGGGVIQDLQLYKDVVLVSQTSGKTEALSPIDGYTEAQFTVSGGSNINFTWPASDNIIYRIDGTKLRVIEHPAAESGAKTLAEIDLPLWVFGIASEGTLLYATGHSFQVIDALNPAAPKLRGKLEIEREQVSVSGRLACLWEKAPGLDIIDISNADEPKLLASALQELPYRVKDVAMVGRRVLVGCGSLGLGILELQAPDPAEPPPAVLVTEDDFMAAAEDIINGDAGGVDELERLAEAVNAQQIQEGEPGFVYLVDVSVAPFERIGTEAAQGNAGAEAALVDAMDRKTLHSWAGYGIAKAAELGNKKMLQYLLDYQANNLLLSTAVMQLVAAANAGNEKAIAFLSDVTKEEGNRPLGFMVMTGIGKPTENGNRVAIEAVARIAKGGSSDQTTNMALKALLAAAANGHAEAAAALQNLGRDQVP